MFSLMLFDLDGTLTNPYEGISNAFIYALKAFDMQADEGVMRTLIGPPLYESFSKIFGLGEEDTVRAVKYYREYFADRGIFENELYPDTVSVLKELKAAGVRLAVATSKPQEYAERILRHFDIYDYFEGVYGARLETAPYDKADIIKGAVSGEADGRGIIMCGDREHDVLGAKANNLAAAGLLHGFGSREELVRAGADYIFENLTAMLALIG